MIPGQDGQVATASLPSLSLLPHRIEFHLSKESSLSFNGSSFKAQNTSIPDASELSNANSEDHMDSDVKLRTIVRRIGAGLENLGNTCFLNSVLQCLTYTEPLLAYLQSGKHQNSCRVNGFCALCAIQRHVTRALQLTGKVLAPKELVSNLRRTSRNFRTGRQEDAHEYMVHLLEAMHKCCLPSGVPSESPGSYEKSLVHKIFGGCLRSQVRCLQCSYCSDKFDPFLDLSLEIVKAHSLQKALTHFTAREQLDGGERQYQCPRCKQKVQALKQLTIDKVPSVLTIHLKRFGSHVSGQKIDKKVQFGSTLDLKPYVSGSYEECDLNYALYGVLVHAGWSTHSGHYYCFVRTSSGMWYSLDDNRVIQVSERIVLEQKAYVLFYVREGKTSAPKNIANDIQKNNMFPTSIQNGSNYISATSQRLKNRSMDGPSGVVLRKDVSTPVVNGLCSTSITSHGFQNESADGSVNFIKMDKSIISFPPNGSAASYDVRQGHPKRSGNDDLKVKLQENMSANKCHDIDASDDIVQSNLPNAPTGDDDKILKSSDNFSEYKNCKTSLFVMGAKPSKYATDAAAEIAPKSCDEAGLPSNAFDVSSRQKSKKKVLKSKVVSMHLSARMLYGVSLGLHRRNKHRKIRKSNQCSVATSILDEDMGPSTSPATSSDILRDSGSSPRKQCIGGVSMRGTDGAKITLISSGASAVENIPSELEKGMAFGGAGDDQNLKASNSPVISKQQHDGKSPHLISKTVVDKGIANSPGNFKVNGVARWDDLEVGPSHGVDSHTTNNIRIGYVPDEWDEEYDRGKRKKVRMSKFSFDGGPNPFQEVATKAAKSEARRKGNTTLPVNTYGYE